MKRRLLQGMAAVLLATAAMGARCDGFFNLTQPLTDPITLGFLNRTPYRAIFTFGAYDPLDQTSTVEPVSGQLRLSPGDPDDPQQGVAWFTTSRCRRAASIGSQELLDLIDARDVEVQDEQALILGVNFSDAPEGSPDEANPTVGTAEPITVLNGIDYPCGSLVIFEFVEDAGAEGGFRVEVSVIF